MSLESRILYLSVYDPLKAEVKRKFPGTAQFCFIVNRKLLCSRQSEGTASKETDVSSASLLSISWRAKLATRERASDRQSSRTRVSFRVLLSRDFSRLHQMGGLLAGKLGPLLALTRSEINDDIMIRSTIIKIILLNMLRSMPLTDLELCTCQNR